MVRRAGKIGALFRRDSAMSINSRSKGQRGERQWRDEIRAAGWQAERGQQRSGSPDSPDVKTDMPIHFEVKAVEKLNLGAAVEQA